MKYDYTNGIDTRRLLSEQHNTHYRFFSHDNYTFTIFIDAVFIQILLKKPDCDKYKSRRRLSGNGCGYSKHHISKFLHFLEQMKIFSIHVIH